MARKAEKQMTGSTFIYAGLALCAIAVILIALPGDPPSSGKAEWLTLFGIPGGVVCIIIGAVMVIRERRR